MRDIAVLCSYHIDLVFHILAHIQVDDVDNLYSPDYIAGINQAKAASNVPRNLEVRLQPLSAIYRSRKAELFKIGFFSFFAEDLEAYRQLLLKNFTSADPEISQFLKIFLEILDMEDTFYSVYWRDLSWRSKRLFNEYSDYLCMRDTPLELVANRLSSDVNVFACHGLTRFGRGVCEINGRQTVATFFPYTEDRIVQAMLIACHELTHQIVWRRVGGDAPGAVIDMGLLERMVELLDYFVIKELYPDLLDSFFVHYREAFGGAVAGPDFPESLALADSHRRIVADEFAKIKDLRLRRGVATGWERKA